MVFVAAIHHAHTAACRDHVNVLQLCCVSEDKLTRPVYAQRCHSALRRPAGPVSHLRKRADPQHKLLPRLCTFVSGPTRSSAVVGFNHPPFAVHLLAIHMFIYVITGGTFLCCTCSVAI